MRVEKPQFLTFIAAALVGLISIGTTQALAADAKTNSLKIKLPAENKWGKKRLVSKTKDGVVRISDTKKAAEFNDASLWEIKIGQKLKPGRKVFSVELELGSKHKPLWGNTVLSPLLNGKPAVPSTGPEDEPAIELVKGGDDRAYVSFGTKAMSFELKENEKSLRSFSFYLAGAQATDVQLKNFKITIWPEAASKKSLDKNTPSKIVLSNLPFPAKGQKIILLESEKQKKKKPVKTLTLDVEGARGASKVKMPLKPKFSVASRSIVSTLDLSAVKRPGIYKVTIPPHGKQTEPTSANFEVAQMGKMLKQARSEAWSTFYWLTDNETGPYKGAHQQDKAAPVFEDKSKRRDVRGGWFDAGDYGKYSVNGAYSVSLMLLTGLLAPDALDHSIDKVAGGISSQPDWLNVAETELAWLLTMQGPDGGVSHKAATKKFPGMNVKPSDDDNLKWVMPDTSTATADFAATMSLASLVYQKLPNEAGKLRAKLFESAAQKAQKWLSKNAQLKMIEFKYDDHDYGGPYHDDNDSDERFFARAAFAALTRDPKAIKTALEDLEIRAKVFVSEEPSLDWRSVDLLGVWTLYLIRDELNEKAQKMVREVLTFAADTWLKEKQKAPWRISFADTSELYWGSNGVLATTAWHWLLLSKQSGDEKYAMAAQDQLNWFFGRNPLNKTFVTGNYPNSVKAPHFRPSTSGAIKLPAGLLVGGPNSGDASKEDFPREAPMRMYEDDAESFTTNEIAINWQAAWALYLSLAAEKY